MFDAYARDLIDKLPELPGLDRAECRRALSRAYLLIVDARIQATGARELPVEAASLRATLRQMANALESVAVFDPLNGIEVARATREASAFVAAEALSLVAELSPPSQPEDVAGDSLNDPRTYALIESALLFMIGGYDINAVAVVSQLPVAEAPEGEGIHVVRCRNGARLRRRIEALCRGQLNPLDDGSAPELGECPVLFEDLSDETRARLYEALAESIDEYREWLGGDGDDDDVIGRITTIRRACQPQERADDITLRLFPYADVYHLASLLAAAIDATKERSVVHRVPPPADGDQQIRDQFPDYIRTRAQGTQRLRGRPFLWPSTVEYVRSCLPGPSMDAVVSMPTGSGKSFLAELAVAHALSRGWVLYLAPTNALVHQIRRDLDKALEPFSDVKVTSFVGGAEYTTLSDEQVTAGRFVGVMTPEKCALALRLYPAAFANCALCVFDECHLLNDPSRGAVADVLLAQLFRAAPNMRTLLMSAMVANADELAAWLTTVRRADAVPSRIKWRPSRAARCVAFLDSAALASARAELTVELDGMRGAGTVSREVAIGWLAGLSGPWTRDGADDYRATRLPLTASVERKRARNGHIREVLESWKNRTGHVIAELFALRGIPSINFLLSSRHHAFGSADRVESTMPGAIGVGPFPPLVEAQLAVADAELGVETALRGLLRKGVCVHTGAMLQVEQAASEWMFAEGKAKLMFATGTLAQGLNLPAVAVVVSGSKIGNPQDLLGADAAAGLTRANELILNGFGRAGRPGFSNQGIVILVSDKPVMAPVADDLVGDTMIARYPVLAEPDASVSVHSPIEKFLDDLMAAEDVANATRLELALTSLLSTFEGEEENAGTILRRTFAGFRRREVFTAERATMATARIADLKARFLEGDGVPVWMPEAAMKAGVDFFRAQRMWQAYSARGLVNAEQLRTFGIREWFDTFIEVLGHMPIARVRDYLDVKPAPRPPRDGRAPRATTTTPRTRLGALSTGIRDVDAVPWTRPEGWDVAWRELGAVVFAYMEGKPLTEVGSALFGAPANGFTSKRSDAARGLPPVFKFLGDIVDRAMSIDAGCFLALHECWLAAERPGISVPESLQALPLCIRNGCDSLDVLAWFRFGFRQRMCAHALAEAFPLPADVAGDAARAQAVRDLRREWLRAEPNGDASLLDFARVIVKDGSSERT